MKKDINLLIQRKTPQSERKRKSGLFIILFVVVLLAAIILPSRARVQAVLKLGLLQMQIGAVSVSEQDLAEATANVMTTKNLRTELESLNGSRSDILSYLSAIEGSLPNTARLTNLAFAGNTVSFTGVAPNDDVVATFCLKLRQTGLFQSVFLTSSMVAESGEALFSVSATLPHSLGGDVVELPESEPEEAQLSGEELMNKLLSAQEELQ